jgi:hypothetical protein
LLNFVFTNFIEKATHVTLFWNLSRNPDKISSKNPRKNAKFDEKNEKNKKFIKIQYLVFNLEKMLAIFG